MNYDLLEWPAVPESQQAPKPQPPKPTKKSKPAEIRVERVEEPVAKESASDRVVEFSVPTPEDKSPPNEEVDKIKEQVRLAMKALEEGKQVAAFNLLKRIVE